jgi:hydroxypyruvate isomerase
MPFSLSANIDLLFTEAGDLPERLAAAADAGFDAVEFWTTSDRDVDAIHRVAVDRGVEITAILGEPRTDITFPDTDLAVYFDGIARTVERAHLLGCTRIVVSGGTGHMGTKRPAQLERVADVYAEVVARTEGSGVEFLLEAFNVRVDHPGALLDRTRDAVDIARTIASGRFGVLYDMYHSLTEGEDPATELAAGAGLIRYLQLADVPGRGEPGSGGIDWPALFGVVAASGYTGHIGLEFYPTTPTVDAVRFIREVNDAT